VLARLGFQEGPRPGPPERYHPNCKSLVPTVSSEVSRFMLRSGMRSTELGRHLSEIPNRLPMPRHFLFQFLNRFSVAFHVIRKCRSETCGRPNNVCSLVSGPGLNKSIVNQPEHLQTRRTERRPSGSVALGVGQHQFRVADLGIGLPTLRTLNYGFSSFLSVSHVGSFL
jgi:hypothetical protein